MWLNNFLKFIYTNLYSIKKENLQYFVQSPKRKKVSNQKHSNGFILYLEVSHSEQQANTKAKERLGIRSHFQVFS